MPAGSQYLENDIQQIKKLQKVINNFSVESLQVWKQVRALASKPGKERSSFSNVKHFFVVALFASFVLILCGYVDSENSYLYSGFLILFLSTAILLLKRNAVLKKLELYKEDIAKIKEIQGTSDWKKIEQSFEENDLTYNSMFYF